MKAVEQQLLSYWIERSVCCRTTRLYPLWFVFLPNAHFQHPPLRLQICDSSTQEKTKLTYLLDCSSKIIILICDQSRHIGLESRQGMPSGSEKDLAAAVSGTTSNLASPDGTGSRANLVLLGRSWWPLVAMRRAVVQVFTSSRRKRQLQSGQTSDDPGARVSSFHYSRRDAVHFDDHDHGLEADV